MSTRAFFLMMGVGLLLSMASAATSSGPIPAGLPVPPFPYAAYQNHQAGCVIVRVIFGNNGQVTDCAVLRSSGAEVLDRSTVDFIKRHWKSSALAGKTVRLPVTYALPGTEPEPRSLGEINHLSPTSPERTVVLQVTFAADGSVSDVAIAQSSGFDRLDQDTVTFVWTHWSSVANAGHTVRVPIVFKPKAAKNPAPAIPSGSQGQAGG